MANLPDIEQRAHRMLTSSFDRKWKKEGRYDGNGRIRRFFKRTGYPKTPRYYIIKWLTDISLIMELTDTARIQ
jgi:alpha-amylase